MCKVVWKYFNDKRDSVSSYPDRLALGSHDADLHPPPPVWSSQIKNINTTCSGYLCGLSNHFSNCYWLQTCVDQWMAALQLSLLLRYCFYWAMLCVIMNNNHPPASIWEPICDGKQGNYYCWPYAINHINLLCSGHPGNIQPGSCGNGKVWGRGCISTREPTIQLAVVA